jgi:hypothetical protein
VPRVCYPDSVLFHVRLRGVTDEQVEVLADAPGFSCRPNDDGTHVVRMRFAHDVPSHPDTEAMEQQLRLALQAMAPDSEVIDVRFGLRYARDETSPAVDALHRLRRDVERLAAPDDLGRDLSRDELEEALTAFAREFRHLDEWLTNGGSIPADWARRHPAGDMQAAEQIADSLADTAIKVEPSTHAVPVPAVAAVS